MVPDAVKILTSLGFSEQKNPTEYLRSYIVTLRMVLRLRIFFRDFPTTPLSIWRPEPASGIPSSIQKYILASSSSLYAGAPAPFREDFDVNRPLSPYAASKLGAEAMSAAFHHLHDIDVSVLRYFTVYGPASRPDMSPLRFLKWIDEGTPITMYGDGSQSRDFTYIDDIVQGTLAALRPVDYEVINLGGGNQPMSINALIAGFEDQLGKKAVVEYQPFHAGDMKSTQADIIKAARLLDWQPQISPTEGFAKTVAWYQENRSWLSEIVL